MLEVEVCAHFRTSHYTKDKLLLQFHIPAAKHKSGIDLFYRWEKMCEQISQTIKLFGQHVLNSMFSTQNRGFLLLSLITYWIKIAKSEPVCQTGLSECIL